MSSDTKKLLTFIIIMLIAIATIVGCVYVLTELGRAKKAAILQVLHLKYRLHR